MPSRRARIALTALAALSVLVVARLARPGDAERRPRVPRRDDVLAHARARSSRARSCELEKGDVACLKPVTFDAETARARFRVQSPRAPGPRIEVVASGPGYRATATTPGPAAGDRGPRRPRVPRAEARGHGQLLLPQQGPDAGAAHRDERGPLADDRRHDGQRGAAARRGDRARPLQARQALARVAPRRADRPRRVDDRRLRARLDPVAGRAAASSARRCSSRAAFALGVWRDPLSRGSGEPAADARR